MNSLEINDVLNAVKAGKGARVEFPTSTLLLTLDESAQVIGRIEDSTGDYEDIDETEVRAIMRREELIKARFQDTP